MIIYYEGKFGIFMDNLLAVTHKRKPLTVYLC